VIRVTLRQLEYFAAAARLGGAARAAESLNVSQPSISKAIADLEALWGERLFVRLHARGLDLTGAGAARYRQARALLQQASQLAGPRTGVLSGLVRVGCLSTLGPRYLPAILARLQHDHPEVEVRFEEGDTEALLQRLARGSLDVALLYDLGISHDVRIEPLAELWPYALLPWGHRLAAYKTVPIAELAKESLVMINLRHSREYFLSLFRAAGLSPTVVRESASLEMVRALVANGLGASLLTTRPRRDVSYDGKRIACRRLQGPLTPQIVGLAYAADDDRQNGLVEAFARTAQACVSAVADPLIGRAPPHRGRASHRD